MRSYHPYTPFIPPRPDKLIIGTIPPARFYQTAGTLKLRDVQFYYGSSDNQFWPIVEQAFQQQFLYDYDNTLQAVEQRQSFLAQSNIGITDLIESCDRENGAAADDSLKNIRNKDIKALLLSIKEYCSIKNFCSSSSA